MMPHHADGLPLPCRWRPAPWFMPIRPLHTATLSYHAQPTPSSLRPMAYACKGLVHRTLPWRIKRPRSTPTHSWPMPPTTAQHNTSALISRLPQPLWFLLREACTRPHSTAAAGRRPAHTPPAKRRSPRTQHSAKATCDHCCLALYCAKYDRARSGYPNTTITDLLVPDLVIMRSRQIDVQSSVVGAWGQHSLFSGAVACRRSEGVLCLGASALMLVQRCVPVPKRAIALAALPPVVQAPDHQEVAGCAAFASRCQPRGARTLEAQQSGGPESSLFLANKCSTGAATLRQANPGDGRLWWKHAQCVWAHARNNRCSNASPGMYTPAVCWGNQFWRRKLRVLSRQLGP